MELRIRFGGCGSAVEEILQCGDRFYAAGAAALGRGSDADACGREVSGEDGRARIWTYAACDAAAPCEECGEALPRANPGTGCDCRGFAQTTGAGSGEGRMQAPASNRRKLLMRN